MINDPVMAVAVRAARRAASVHPRRCARPEAARPSHAKDHAEIAGNADTEAENAIIATLRAAFPEHAIVGEEAGEIVSQIEGGAGAGPNALKWIVDPIDGTANFVHGYPLLRGVDRPRRTAARSRTRSCSTRSTTSSSRRSGARARS